MWNIYFNQSIASSLLSWLALLVALAPLSSIITCTDETDFNIK